MNCETNHGARFATSPAWLDSSDFRFRAIYDLQKAWAAHRTDGSPLREIEIRLPSEGSRLSRGDTKWRFYLSLLQDCAGSGIIRVPGNGMFTAHRLVRRSLNPFSLSLSDLDRRGLRQRD